MTVNEEINVGNVLEKVASLLPRGYRFVTMTAVDSTSHFDIYYHFDLDYELYTLQLKLGREEKVPSISPVCFAALIVENEIQDLFGITFAGLVLDYEKRFLLSEGAPERPFCRVPGVSVTAVDTKADGGVK
ncbi:MAG: NADH-quinone oxidoreductase subunit C [Victivallaceae bacterium]